MTYRIARGGQVFGPYSDAEMRQYIASGNVGLSDHVQVDGSTNWVRVLDLFPLTTPPMPAASSARSMVAPVLYPDPPDFPWWAALLLGMLTGGVFFVIWDIVEASWLKRIERQSSALFLYIAVAVLYLIKLPDILIAMRHSIFRGPFVHPHGALGTAAFIVVIVARFRFRRELLDHFNVHEGLALRLSGLWTLVLGGLYFQYHFNQINAVKRATNRSVSVV